MGWGRWVVQVLILSYVSHTLPSLSLFVFPFDADTIPQSTISHPPISRSIAFFKFPIRHWNNSQSNPARRGRSPRNGAQERERSADARGWRWRRDGGGAGREGAGDRGPRDRVSGGSINSLIHSHVIVLPGGFEVEKG